MQLLTNSEQIAANEMTVAAIRTDRKCDHLVPPAIRNAQLHNIVVIFGCDGDSLSTLQAHRQPQMQLGGNHSC